MAKPFYLIWQEGTTVLEGYDGANSHQNSSEGGIMILVVSRKQLR